ncbi:hypothetical protein THIX_20102 [Thiomonas sp. X19]|nr:hypothetical protein THIX_20102 [Thiomonas sp. X19]
MHAMGVKERRERTKKAADPGAERVPDVKRPPCGLSPIGWRLRRSNGCPISEFARHVRHAGS